ncbi:MAG: sterol desaturase family protein [Nitrococcus sp.]|nr:sterol desaturase family protein [Nitrococcus sp.]
MNEWLIHNEPTVRLVIFLGMFAVMVALERLLPRRRSVHRGRRWWPNLAMLAADGLVLRLAFPLLAVGTALAAADAGFGLFNVIAVPYAAAFVSSVLLLDLIIYAQHVLMHKVPLLWRLHRVHHSDLEFDVTTGVRFHPAEIALSMGIKMAAVALLGPPAAAVIALEVLLNATSLFNHTNLDLPAPLDRLLRLMLVTPDMHRVHHSEHRDETDSNYGFNVPWWDRLFGTYRAQPRAGHQAMRIGIGAFTRPVDQTFRSLLTQPLRSVRNSGASVHERHA